MLYKVISGGQIGADQAGLIAAKKAGLQTGGWLPKGCRTLNGPRPHLVEEYGLKETPESNYLQRTAWNVRDSDGTVRLATDFASAGEIATLKYIKKYNKPYFDVDLNYAIVTKYVCNSQHFREWIKSNNIGILNVAGNSEHTSPKITVNAVEFLSIVFGVVTTNEHN